MTSAHRHLFLTAAAMPWMKARAVDGVHLRIGSFGDARFIRRLVAVR